LQFIVSFIIIFGTLSFPIASSVVGFCVTVGCCVLCVVHAACCDLNLMDASRQVVIDTGQLLKPGVYRAVSVRLCTAEEMLIQVWTPISTERFQLKWQIAFTPTAADTLLSQVAVILARH